MKRLQRISLVLICVISVLLIQGCKAKVKENDFMYTVAVRGYLYGLSDVEIPLSDIDARIENGVVSCKFSECPAPDGQIFYTLHSSAVYEAIGREVEINNGEKIYKKCIKIRKIKLLQ